MESDFLKNLKTAVDTGEFNSEAAKKILEINKLAEDKLKEAMKGGKPIIELVDDRLEKAGVKTVTEEEAAAINPEYDKKMAKMKEDEATNKKIAEQINVADNQLQVLDEIEEMVQQSVNDMISFIDELELKFVVEFRENNTIFETLKAKISEIKKKYGINNN
jgi:hypothetical protein